MEYSYSTVLSTDEWYAAVDSCTVYNAIVTFGKSARNDQMVNIDARMPDSPVEAVLPSRVMRSDLICLVLDSTLPATS